MCAIGDGRYVRIFGNGERRSRCKFGFIIFQLFSINLFINIQLIGILLWGGGGGRAFRIYLEIEFFCIEKMFDFIEAKTQIFFVVVDFNIFGWFDDVQNENECSAIQNLIFGRSVFLYIEIFCRFLTQRIRPENGGNSSSANVRVVTCSGCFSSNRFATIRKSSNRIFKYEFFKFEFSTRWIFFILHFFIFVLRGRGGRRRRAGSSNHIPKWIY